MSLDFKPVSGVLSSLDLLQIEVHDAVMHIRLNRPEKRNAVNDTMLHQLQTCFVNMPAEIGAAILTGAGDHFCAGLDLSELTERTVAEGVFHSRCWHAAMDTIQSGRVPVVSVLHGAVIGGGMEIASATHIRIAEETAYYALPEGQRGIFVGGGGSVRIPRLIGVAAMTEMMLTGAVIDALEGKLLGFSRYVVAQNQGFAKACELAVKIASNTPLSNFAVLQALPRIADMSPSDGLFVEALMIGIVQGDAAAKQRVRDFLEKRGGKVGKVA
ncbi:MAG: crotonase/enoyl-CoA hydratase family protein [Rhodoferax sp.]|nr:crotonase/enoyl-CoA hydratase family protein [Rhodoferax sp.]